MAMSVPAKLTWPRPSGLKLVKEATKSVSPAYEEYKNPTRTLTSTVAIHNTALPRLPVKTSKALPKDLVCRAMDETNKIELEGPVRMGDVIIRDLLGTGIDVVATRSLE